MAVKRDAGPVSDRGSLQMADHAPDDAAVNDGGRLSIARHADDDGRARQESVGGFDLHSINGDIHDRHIVTGTNPCGL